MARREFKCIGDRRGHGRIAKPLLAAGVRITGIDLSRNMMNRLRETLGDLPAPALLNGDITRLPFASESFDAVIGVHILHLVAAGSRPSMKRCA